jgi:hypothetical protein
MDPEKSLQDKAMDLAMDAEQFLQYAQNDNNQ